MYYKNGRRMIRPTASKKLISNLCNVLIFLLGATFIFSGLIKLNDPVGTKIKLEEYFEVFAQDIPAMAVFFELLVPLSLSLALVLCVAEVVLGISVLLKYNLKNTLWLILSLIIFFTFLTFYSAYFNKVTDCGCFGDAIKLKPWSSFTKDLILLLTTVILIFQYHNIKIKNIPFAGAIVSISTFLAAALGLYAIFYLPPIDFLPYKVGANIPKNMEIPANAKPDVYKITYTLKNIKTGEEKKMDDATYMQKEVWKDTLNWKITNSVSDLISEGDKPKIIGFSVWDVKNNDFTQDLFKGNIFLIIVQNFNSATPNNLRRINQLVNGDKINDIHFVLLTSSDGKSTDLFMQEMKLNIPYYFADATLLKTMVRTNPGFILLKNGTVVKKWSVLNIPDGKEIRDNLQIK